ncbi:MAG: beta-lactamase [Microbacteriaceae bacterium]|nr:beta-lactamase [Microbacteriaceae bacterium]
MTTEVHTSTPEEVGLSSAGLDTVDAIVQDAVDRKQIAGAVTLVARHGTIVRTRVMGVDHRFPRKKLTEDSIFHIFSMTKPVTGLAMSILADRGLWHPDDLISKHLPEFANLRVLTGFDERGNPILEDAEHAPTMLELMTHRAGFGYGQDKVRPETRLYKKVQPLKATSLDDFIARVATLPLAYQPGLRWQYSISMDIQGAIVERLTGRRYADFLREEVFEPLGMTDTGFFVPPVKRKRLARLHLSTSRLKLLPFYNFLFPDHFSEPGAAYGGMGLYSTAGDYARFAQLLLNQGEWNGKRIVSAKALKAQMTNHLPGEMLEKRWDAGHMHFRPGFGYGYNGTVVYDPAAAGLPVGAGTYFWDGAAGTWFWVDPENDLLYVGMVQIFSYGAPALQAMTQTAMAEAIL